MHQHNSHLIVGALLLPLPDDAGQMFEFLSAGFRELISTVEQQGCPRAVAESGAFRAVEDLTRPYEKHPMPAAVASSALLGAVRAIRLAAPMATSEKISSWLRQVADEMLDRDACRSAYLSRTEFKSIEQPMKAFVVLEGVRRGLR